MDGKTNMVATAELLPRLEELRDAFDDALVACETIEQLRAMGDDVAEDNATFRRNLHKLGLALIALAGESSSAHISQTDRR